MGERALPLFYSDFTADPLQAVRAMEEKEREVESLRAELQDEREVQNAVVEELHEQQSRCADLEQLLIEEQIKSQGLEQRLTAKEGTHTQLAQESGRAEQLEAALSESEVSPQLRSPSGILTTRCSRLVPITSVGYRPSTLAGARRGALRAAEGRTGAPREHAGAAGEVRHEDIEGQRGRFGACCTQRRLVAW
jgi:hypothetical protein